MERLYKDANRVFVVHSNAIALGPDGFYYLKITPSTELRSRLLVDFHRLDWCLDTTEFGLM